ncbi:VTT domain-containing protein, partial [Klebsiella pneumoniae]|nr:VTT domain-containing protein [Klebsiella pneumoniae]
MNGPLVFFLAVTGALTGSLLNYYIAYYCGRYMLVRYGKYMFMNEEKLAKMEAYFAKHGPASIFFGRLLFGVRHFISFPAGLARM